MRIWHGIATKIWRFQVGDTKKLCHKAGKPVVRVAIEHLVMIKGSFNHLHAPGMNAWRTVTYDSSCCTSAQKQSLVSEYRRNMTQIRPTMAYGTSKLWYSRQKIFIPNPKGVQVFRGSSRGPPVISSRQGKWLLETGSDVKERDSCQWTPLHAASAEGHTEVVEWLLKQGGGPFLRTTEMSQK